LSLSVDDQHGSRDIVVLALCDDIPLLVGVSVTGCNLDRRQVGAKVAREDIGKKALPIGGLERNLNGSIWDVNGGVYGP